MTKGCSSRKFAIIIALALLASWIATPFPIEQAAAAQGKRTVSAQHKNNLQHVDCRKHDADYTGVTTISVDGTDGIAPDDEAIFVCTGEKLQWMAGTGVKTMEISFATTEWPFRERYTAKLAGDGAHPTASQSVSDLPSGHRIRVYKYTIHVVTSDNRSIDLDPHVIPMGP
jgi:hypothetical protein